MKRQRDPKTANNLLPVTLLIGSLLVCAMVAPVEAINESMVAGTHYDLQRSPPSSHSAEPNNRSNHPPPSGQTDTLAPKRHPHPHQHHQHQPDTQYVVATTASPATTSTTTQESSLYHLSAHHLLKSRHLVHVVACPSEASIHPCECVKVERNLGNDDDNDEPDDTMFSEPASSTVAPTTITIEAVTAGTRTTKEATTSTTTTTTTTTTRAPATTTTTPRPTTAGKTTPTARFANTMAPPTRRPVYPHPQPQPHSHSGTGRRATTDNGQGAPAPTAAALSAYTPVGQPDQSIVEAQLQEVPVLSGHATRTLPPSSNNDLGDELAASVVALEGAPVEGVTSNSETTLPASATTSPTTAAAASVTTTMAPYTTSVTEAPTTTGVPPTTTTTTHSTASQAPTTTTTSTPNMAPSSTTAVAPASVSVGPNVTMAPAEPKTASVLQLEEGRTSASPLTITGDEHYARLSDPTTVSPLATPSTSPTATLETTSTTTSPPPTTTTTPTTTSTAATTTEAASSTTVVTVPETTTSPWSVETSTTTQFVVGGIKTGPNAGSADMSQPLVELSTTTVQPVVEAESTITILAPQHKPLVSTITSVPIVLESATTSLVASRDRHSETTTTTTTSTTPQLDVSTTTKPSLLNDSSAAPTTLTNETINHVVESSTTRQPELEPSTTTVASPVKTIYRTTTTASPPTTTTTTKIPPESLETTTIGLDNSTDPSISLVPTLTPTLAPVVTLPPSPVPIEGPSTTPGPVVVVSNSTEGSHPSEEVHQPIVGARPIRNQSSLIWPNGRSALPMWPAVPTSPFGSTDHDGDHVAAASTTTFVSSIMPFASVASALPTITTTTETESTTPSTTTTPITTTASAPSTTTARVPASTLQPLEETRAVSTTTTTPSNPRPLSSTTQARSESTTPTATTTTTAPITDQSSRQTEMPVNGYRGSTVAHHDPTGQSITTGDGDQRASTPGYVSTHQANSGRNGPSDYHEVSSSARLVSLPRTPKMTMGTSAPPSSSLPTRSSPTTPISYTTAIQHHQTTARPILGGATYSTLRPATLTPRQQHYPTTPMAITSTTTTTSHSNLNNNHSHNHNHQQRQQQQQQHRQSTPASSSSYHSTAGHGGATVTPLVVLSSPSTTMNRIQHLHPTTLTTFRPTTTNSAAYTSRSSHGYNNNNSGGQSSATTMARSTRPYPPPTNHHQLVNERKRRDLTQHQQSKQQHRQTTIDSVRQMTINQTQVAHYRVAKQAPSEPVDSDDDKYETIAYCRNIRNQDVLQQAIKGFRGHRVHYFVIDSCKIKPFPNDLFDGIDVRWLEMVNTTVQFHNNFLHSQSANHPHHLVHRDIRPHHYKIRKRRSAKVASIFESTNR